MTGTKRRVQARRDRLRELGKQDRVSRCAYCKTPLSRVRIQMGEPFCSTECGEDDAAFQERWAVAKAKGSR